MGERRTIYYFQWLRALGAVAIVMLHAFVTVHIAAGEELVPLRYSIEEAISIPLARWAVPVFFMMSGALMLDPEREMGWRKTLKHVWRLGFVLLTFGYLFCAIKLYDEWGGHIDGMGFYTALLMLLHQNSWSHMWFVYELLGFYLMTPFVRAWLAQASREEYRNVSIGVCILLLGTRFVSAFIPFVIYYGVSIPHCFAYYLIGYYVHRYLELDRRWVLAGLGSLVLTEVLAIGFGLGWASEPIRGLVLPYSVMVMLAAKRYLDRPLGEHPIVSVLADYSFGIYLIHPAFQHLLARFYDIPSWNPVVCFVVLTVVPLVGSMAVVWLLRLIPIFRDKL